MSFSEILRKVPIAKSTLSLWIRPVPFIRPTKSVLRRKLLKAGKLGAEAKRKQRKVKTEKIMRLARSEVGKINTKQLLVAGAMLYWAEGSKEKEDNVSQQVAFANSDPQMCKFFIKWVKDCLGVTEDRIVPSIYMHISRKYKSQEALDFWSQAIGVSKDRFKKTSFTNTKLSERNRRKDSGKYYGVLRIRIKRSTDLNRRITGLIQGMCLRCGVS